MRSVVQIAAAASELVPPKLTSVVAGLLMLGVVLWPLEQLFPVRRQRLLRRELRTDLAYGGM